ncbi:TetR family transcriptional regulator [Leucobacter viscericola]|uniref:TetR family transcriptional regulator n=1 Tax=Leucobacter viscericola TaxID=2714935 RepID=A0A6G7XG93_9MICO|nr:TetR family transcriptional regulator [Leucobacter viscericola]QIK63391.1 TetR family transcriptional regulator [Leucobacter viscericola]
MEKTFDELRGSASVGREKMVAAAASLLIEQGPDSITHRKVAEAAHVPLGSANYFFPTKKQLYAFAVEAAEAMRLQSAQQMADSLAPAPRTPAETAKLLIQTWYAPHVGPDVVRARLYPMIDALHDPELGAVMGKSRPKLLAVLTEVLEKCGFANAKDADLVALVLDGSLLYDRHSSEPDTLKIAERQVARQLVLITASAVTLSGVSAGTGTKAGQDRPFPSG